MTSVALHPVWIEVMGDPFLRRLLLRLFYKYLKLLFPFFFVLINNLNASLDASCCVAALFDTVASQTRES